MLRRLEERYGPSTSRFTLLGIEFAESGPQVWFPWSKYVIVQLNTRAIGSLERACYELAHEAVYLLSPAGRNDATVLEEGPATHFSREYLRQEFGKAMAPKGDRYGEALKRVETLLEVDGTAVRTLREVEPVLSQIGEDLLLQLYPGMDETLAATLARPFDEL